MGCCGKTITSDLKKSVHIAKGAANSVLKVNKELSQKRKDICGFCDKSTWLIINEYRQWMNDNNLDNYEKLEKAEMPIKKRVQGTKMFCSICKCRIDWKSSLKDEKCPLRKWSKL